MEQQRKLNAIGRPFERVLCWPIFGSDILTAGRGRIVLLHLIQKLDYHCSTFPFSGTWRDTDSLCGGLWFWLIEHVTQGKSTSLNFWSIFPTSHSGFSDISVIKRDDTLLVSRSSSQHIAEGKGLIENNVYLVSCHVCNCFREWDLMQEKFSHLDSNSYYRRLRGYSIFWWK